MNTGKKHAVKDWISEVGSVLSWMPILIAVCFAFTLAHRVGFHQVFDFVFINIDDWHSSIIESSNDVFNILLQFTFAIGLAWTMLLLAPIVDKRVSYRIIALSLMLILAALVSFRLFGGIHRYVSELRLIRLSSVVMLIAVVPALAIMYARSKRDILMLISVFLFILGCAACHLLGTAQAIRKANAAGRTTLITKEGTQEISGFVGILGSGGVLLCEKISPSEFTGCRFFYKEAVKSIKFDRFIADW
jgi:hypothetical protein